MIVATAVVSLALLFLLSIFQLALALGAPLGNFAWGGAHKVLPRKLRVASIFSIGIYAGIALFIASKAGIIDVAINERVLAIGMWVLFGYFTLGIFLNSISKSKRERYTMTPVCIILALATLTLAWLPGTSQPPIFSFNEQQAPGWWAAGNHNAQALTFVRQ